MFFHCHRQRPYPRPGDDYADDGYANAQYERQLHEHDPWQRILAKHAGRVPTVERCCSPRVVLVSPGNDLRREHWQLTDHSKARQLAEYV